MGTNMISIMVMDSCRGAVIIYKTFDTGAPVRTKYMNTKPCFESTWPYSCFPGINNSANQQALLFTPI